VVNTDDNTQQFIIDQYEKAIENRSGSIDKSKDDILQEVYLKMRREDTDWDDIYRMAEEHEQSHEILLDEVKSFVDKLDDNDFVKSTNNDDVTSDLSEGKKQALITQIQAQPGKENLIYTDEPISNIDRNILTTEIYESTGGPEKGERKAAFIISKQHSWSGRISLELSRTRERFNLTSYYTNSEGQSRFQHFGESSKNKGLTEIHTHTHSFYQYKFIADDKEYILLSDDKLEPMRCTIHGTKVPVSDYKNVGENRKLPVDQEIIFVHSFEPAIKPMSQDEIDEYRSTLDHEALASHLFGEFRQPEWYEKMMFGIMSVKDDNGYPSHLMIMAEAGTGKSAQLEALSKAMDEGKPPFTGTSSTVKGLVPSFKESPPDEGFLMRCDRVAAVDEKFNLLANTVQNGNTRMQDAFRPMLDLLEHSSREFSSGNGSITGKTEATMIAMGNPAYGIKSIYEAIENDKIDEAYLSRFLLYDQLESHIDFIQQRKNETASGSDDDYLPETDDQFVSLMDTLRMRHVDGIDHNRIGEIHDDLAEIVPSVFATTFRARYKHHIINMVAGMAKYHYIVDDRELFAVQDSDYTEAKEILEMLISSWGEIDKTRLTYKARVNSLTDEPRQVFEAINEEPGIVGSELYERVEVEEMAWAMTELNKLDLVTCIEEDGRKEYYPYWSREYKEAKDLLNDEEDEAEVIKE